ncbi:MULTISPECIES: hypothetical protein [Saccharothrix]|uniref:Uncharacterized protein n=1 Tax=Saccharothrix texasensis TaxID=103734 RepID=A0A3N1GZJ9_9PSEU|nr:MULTISPECIES: hypothetical protein [Saccharothrix]ROP35619.1 hypothetical protein EDD40_0857 [Saccharothrix texasensis]
MSATIAVPTTTRSQSPIRNGALAGLAGGLVFGLLMAGVGSLSMVGMLIGVENAVVGFIVHMVISAIAGAGFGLLTRNMTLVPPVYALSMIYGAVWWVLGALIIMPLWLSVTADPMMSDMVFVVGGAQWVSLFGHVVGFGMTTGAVLLVLRGQAK